MQRKKEDTLKIGRFPTDWLPWYCLLEEKESMLKEQAAAKDEELERTKEALHERETAMIAGS